MATSEPAPQSPPSAVDAAPKALWAERTGTRAYTGRNSRGAEVLVGDGEGQFTPGELLQIALATCSTLSADHRLAHALGDDFAATVGVSAEKDEEENRYSAIIAEIVTDLSGLDEATLAKTLERAELAIERQCTVGRTLEAGAGHTIRFTDEVAG
ncbi:OsmC family protein [Georgenia deserti]|uniref:OsmC family protein n=1 Tax=Georgenia deserti TaxID=2093781 RepID=A0ABW4L3E9_9MICO